MKRKPEHTFSITRGMNPKGSNPWLHRLGSPYEFDITNYATLVAVTNMCWTDIKLENECRKLESVETKPSQKLLVIWRFSELFLSCGILEIRGIFTRVPSPSRSSVKGQAPSGYSSVHWWVIKMFRLPCSSSPRGRCCDNDWINSGCAGAMRELDGRWRYHALLNLQPRNPGRIWT
jgi:hypothetical protein